MRGFKFHNGQIVGDLETRPTDKDHVKDYYGFQITPVASASSGSQLYRAEFPNLSIPPMTSGRTTQILILLVFYDLHSQTAGEWEINVSLHPGPPNEYRYDLPPMRIAAVEQGWLPVISGMNPKATYDKSHFSADPRIEQHYLLQLKDKQVRVLDERQLTHPAIASSVAILKDDRQTTLNACKTWLEAWLRPLAEQQTGDLRIYTEKKLPPGVFKPSKTTKTLPVAAFLQDKSWEKLFDYANNYQSVLLSVFPSGSERAIAGIGLQFSHERHYFGKEYEAQMTRTLSVMRGRPFTEEGYGSTLHAFKWVTNRADCFEYLDASISNMERQMDGFAAANGPLAGMERSMHLGTAVRPGRAWQIYHLRECQRAELVRRRRSRLWFAPQNHVNTMVRQCIAHGYAAYVAVPEPDRSSEQRRARTGGSGHGNQRRL